MPDEDMSVRGALEAAFDKEEADDERASDEPEVDAGSGEDASAEPAGGTEPTEAAGEESGASAEESSDGPASPKFLPPEDDQAVAEDTSSAAPESPQEPQERPPVAWRGEAKEAWEKVPQEVRQEVLRREQEVNEVLRESSTSRRFQEAFERTVAPYREMIAAEGGDPLRSTQNLMQTAAVLRIGTPQQKAQTVAQIVKQFGVDINTLDEALVGQGANGSSPGGLTPDVQQYLQQQMGPVNQFMTNMQQAWQERDAAQEKSAEAEVTAFEQNPKYVYYEDVREDMADLMQMAANRNQRMSLEQAYDKAIMMNPRLAVLVARKMEAKRAQEAQKGLQAKKRAATSIQARSPAPPAAKEPTDLRGALNQAWDKASASQI